MAYKRQKRNSKGGSSFYNSPDLIPHFFGEIHHLFFPMYK